MHFGASLRLVRVAAGWSLRDLAGAVGVSPAYLSRVENGHDAPPTPDRLAAIAGALAVSPALLRELAGVATPAAVEASFAARALHDEVLRRGLSPAQIGRVLDFVERTFPEAPRAAGEVATLLAPGRVTRGVRATTLEDAVDVAVSRLGAGAEALGPAFRRLDPGAGAVGGGLVVAHVADGPRRASLVLLDAPLPLAAPDGRPVNAVLVMTGISRDTAGLTTLAHAARLGEASVLAAIRAAHDDAAAIEVVRLGEIGGRATLPPVGASR